MAIFKCGLQAEDGHEALVPTTAWLINIIRLIPTRPAAIRHVSEQITPMKWAFLLVFWFVFRLSDIKELYE